MMQFSNKTCVIQDCSYAALVGSEYCKAHRFSVARLRHLAGKVLKPFWLRAIARTNFLKKLYAGRSPVIAPLAGNARYTNTEWNFSLPLPKDWEVIFENNIQDFPWTQPVRLAGPQGAHGRASVTVVTQVVEDDGMGLAAYMVKAENDLRGAFKNLRLAKKSEQRLLGWPSAWMIYTYRGDSGPRKELNVTTFFGKGRMMWFQFLCETAEEQAHQDFPVFEVIINGLQIGSAGIRHPQVSLVGAPSCGLCGHPFPSGSRPNAMVNLKLGRLIGVCDSCRHA